MLHTNSVVYGLHDTLLAAVCSNYASVHMSQRHTVIVLSVINPRPEGYGSRFVILSVNRATESSAHFFAPVKVRTA